MIKCISHKKVYQNQEIAEEALIGARTHFDYGNQTGPVGVYQCEDCGYYHLTSKGPINKRLAECQLNGKLKLEKEAHQWLHKIKRR